MKISGEVLSNDFARMRIGEATERVRRDQPAQVAG
jgi:general secretion pathway protein F